MPIEGKNHRSKKEAFTQTAKSGLAPVSARDPLDSR